MRVFLFDWDEEAAEKRAAVMRKAGCEVDVETRDGARGCRAVLACPPDAVVLSLEKRPGDGSSDSGLQGGEADPDAVPGRLSGGHREDTGACGGRPVCRK